jgi:hypothetical protein
MKMDMVMGMEMEMEMEMDYRLVHILLKVLRNDSLRISHVRFKLCYVTDYMNNFTTTIQNKMIRYRLQTLY